MTVNISKIYLKHALFFFYIFIESFNDVYFLEDKVQISPKTDKKITSGSVTLGIPNFSIVYKIKAQLIKPRGIKNDFVNKDHENLNLITKFRHFHPLPLNSTPNYEYYQQFLMLYFLKHLGLFIEHLSFY